MATIYVDSDHASLVSIVAFRYHARLGHFLRAESSASALSYPVPPRTVLMGLCGAVLGLEKDQPQQVLETARFAVLGGVPRTHWHRAKLRKTAPEYLSLTMRTSQKAPQGRDEETTLIRQELLVNPDYMVLAALPGSYHQQMAARLESARWHFTPAMGLSEFIARLEWLGQGTATALPQGNYDCSSVTATSYATIDTARIFNDGLAVHLGIERLPRSVSPDRIFVHEDYYVERAGRPLPIRTAHAWQARWGESERVVVWMEGEINRDRSLAVPP